MAIDPPMGVTTLPARQANERHPFHPGFWQQRFAQNILPLLTSLAFHIAILIAGVITYGVVRHMATPRIIERTQIEIPTGGYEIGDQTTLPVGTAGEDRKATRTLLPDAPDEQGWSDHRMDPNRLLSATGGGADQDAGVIGIGMSNSFSPGGKGGPGGAEGETNGPLADFSSFAALGGGINKGIFNVPGKSAGARQRVVFVCDASGSMMQKFDDLRVQLRNAIAPLRPNDAFNIVFFQDTTAAVADQSGLLLGTPSNKAKVNDFIDKVVPRSSTDPLPGLANAFKLKPNVIWLLTDGDFPDNAEVLKFIRDNNHDGVIIHTIAYMDDGAEYQKVLKTIATENHGTFKFVGANDVEGK